MKATEDKDKRKKEFMDELTGIYNRAGFYHFTRELLDQNPNMQFCLVYWNIRRFKVVNNLFGWERGRQNTDSSCRFHERGIWG